VINRTVTETADCAIMAEGNLYLSVLIDNSTALKAANGNLSELNIGVGYYLSSNCYPYPDFSPGYGIGTRTLNSSGMLTVCCMVGNYYFNFTYSGRNYYVSATVKPEIATCMTVYIPSGRVNVTYSQEYQFTC